MAKANPVRLDDRLRRNERIPTGAIDDELMALNPERGEVFGLDPIATRIYRDLDPEKSVDDLIADLVEAYDVDRATCERDTLALLDAMLEAGLVERVGP